MSVAKVYFITGANKGIGLQFVKEILAHSTSNHVIATARNPKAATDLQELAKDCDERLTVLELDISTQESIMAVGIAAASVPIVKLHGIDFLINNAGINPNPGVSVLNETYEDLVNTFKVNSLGALFVTEALLPALRAGKEKKVWAISSYLGSQAGDYTKYPVYMAYSVSKSAVNFIFQKLKAELGPEGFIFNTIHPGYVDTDMTKTSEVPGKITTKEAVHAVMKLVLETKPEDSGKFYTYTGETLAW